MEPRKIIKQYMTTEKSTILKENEAKYTFSVDIRANKRQIKEAVEELFKIEVDSVRTVIMPGKLRTLGRYKGKTPRWKKAIVKVKGDERIPEFENL